MRHDVTLTNGRPAPLSGVWPMRDEDDVMCASRRRRLGPVWSRDGYTSLLKWTSVESITDLDQYRFLVMFLPFYGNICEGKLTTLYFISDFLP